MLSTREATPSAGKEASGRCHGQGPAVAEPPGAMRTAGGRCRQVPALRRTLAHRNAVGRSGPCRPQLCAAFRKSLVPLVFRFNMLFQTLCYVVQHRILPRFKIARGLIERTPCVVASSFQLPHLALPLASLDFHGTEARTRSGALASGTPSAAQIVAGARSSQEIPSSRRPRLAPG